MQRIQAPFDRVCQVAMLEKHNRMLVELLSRQHPSGSLAASDVHALMKVRHTVGFVTVCIRVPYLSQLQIQDSIKQKILD